MNVKLAVSVALISFATAAFAQDGTAIYKTKCALCHGADGQGKAKIGPKLAGTTKTVDQIVALLTKGGASKGIHIKPINGLQADQAKAVAGHVKGLK